MEKRKQMIGGILLLLLALSFASCIREDDPRRQVLIEAKVKERLDEYQQVHRNRCYNEVLKAALVIVDSTMLDNAQGIRVIDSIPRPPKPERPLPPEKKILKDTLQIAPLLPDSLQ
jgi:hypothetical protein